MPQKPKYSYRKINSDDLPMVKRWLYSPHLSQWWGTPEKEMAVIRNDLSDPKISQTIISFKNEPFAYIQDYCILDWPQDYFNHFPPTSRAIDTFIGLPHMLEKGHGSAYMKEHAETLIQKGSQQIVIDPFVGNKRAICAYQNAGFHIISEHKTDEGDICLMAYIHDHKF